MNPETLTEPSEMTDREPFVLEFGEIIRAIRRRPWLIGACVLLTSAAFCVHAMRKPKIYAAAAEIVIDPVLPKVLGDGFDVDNIDARASAETAFYNTQYKIIQSRAVYRQVIAQQQLDTNQDFLTQYGIGHTTIGEQRTKAIESILRGRVLVAPEPKSRVVKLIVEDYDADRAARIANAVADVYMKKSLSDRMSTTHKAAEWLDERVRDFAKDLESSEKELADFKRQHLLVSVSVEDRKNRISAGMTAYNDKFIETKNKLIQLRAEREVLKEATGPNVPLTALSAVPRIKSSETVQGLNKTLITLDQKRAELSSRYGAKHPNMLALIEQFEKIRAAREAEIETIIGALDNEIASLEKQEVSIQGAMSEAVSKAMDLNNLALEYTKLSRQLGTNEKTYETLLKRRLETELSGQLESNFVDWHEKAEPIPYPIRPSVPLSTILGALLGLAIGIAITVGGVLLDNTIHTQQEVEERLRLAFLGLLPKIQQDGKRDLGKNTPEWSRARDMFIAENPKSAVAECARSLRTNLMFLGAERPIRRILLTSAGPSEGKSTTAIALGTTMALAGSKVLLVDTDLRRPRLHKTFGVSGEHGLTSVLLDSSKLDVAVKSTDVRGLDVLPCGPLPPNPSELLHTERFLKLLDQLDERYDRVVFDSPPVNAVTDAIILAQIADGTILVVKAGKTSRDAAKRARRQLVDVKANILGVVLNDVDLKQGVYYRDHYYQYYRSGYAYGHDADTRQA